MNKEQDEAVAVSRNGETKKKIMNILLTIAIFFIPFVFCWVTLKKEYSTKARVMAFGWSAFLIIVIIFSDPDSREQQPPNANVSKEKPNSEPASKEPVKIYVLYDTSRYFLDENKEILGDYIRSEKLTNWSQGRRQSVTTEKGEFIFYLKGDQVVTVYAVSNDGSKSEIWREEGR
jgi:hypothetical protein